MKHLIIIKNDPKSKIFCSAISEWRKSNKDSENLQINELNSLKERMIRSMQVHLIKNLKLLKKILLFLQLQDLQLLL